jgi:hypothetical protein
MGHDKDNAAEVERLRQARIERERHTPPPGSQPESEPPQIQVPDSNTNPPPEGAETPNQTSTRAQPGEVGD